MEELFAGVGRVGDVYTPGAHDVGRVDTLEGSLAGSHVLGDGGDGVGHALGILLDGAGHGAVSNLFLGSVGSVNAEHGDGGRALGAGVVAGSFQSGDSAFSHVVVVADDQLDHVAVGLVVLGQVGKNFAAGMSGGIAYVLDLDSRLYQKVNKAMVNIERVTDKYDVQELKGMIQEHVAYTNSEVGKKILDNFKEYLPKFKKIIPEDYEKMMSTIIQMEEKGLSREKAKIEAFNLIKNGR